MPDLIQLKATAYDLLANIQELERRLKAVTAEIAHRSQNSIQKESEEKISTNLKGDKS